MKDVLEAVISAAAGAVVAEITKRALDALTHAKDETSKAGKHFKRS